MGQDDQDAAPEVSASWRNGWASAGAIVATVLLIFLVVMVMLGNRAREEALAGERHSYDLMLLTRSIDATVARSEAALGRYVLDEEPNTGTLYYNEWRLAGRQIAQLRRMARAGEQSLQVDELRTLYADRGRELAAAASAAAAKRESGGVPLFYQAGRSLTGPALRAKLDSIAAGERDQLRQRMAETRSFAEQADKFTQWLGWLSIVIGLAAILLALAAYRALAEQLQARREAHDEANRAMALEHAVQERTRELRAANERLLAEAAERAAAESQLHQVQKMEAVGQLTGGIAHDFNNMLAVVVGGLDLAKRKLRGSKREVEFHLDNAMEGATRAAALTRRLLAFARSEPLLPEAVAPAVLVENMLDLIDRAIGERITVGTHFDEVPWAVWADANQLENAILNLCVNARDAMNGQGRLDIAIENVVIRPEDSAELAPGDYVRIAVSDTGAGIAPEHLERVFEPFFTTKPVGKGTGLGLSQIFGFARQSGGDVVIESTPDVGTSVSLYLPRSDATDEAARIMRPASPEERAPAKAVRGLSILVVEDDPRVSRSTVAALEEIGHAPTAVSGGGDALALLAAGQRFDLVITDVMMPEMTGPELVRILADRHSDLGVLFVTGFVGEAGEAEELSGYELLRKPFTVSALSEAIETALARRLSGSRPAPASAAAE